MPAIRNVYRRWHGLPPEKLEQLVRDAGFTGFVVHDLDDPVNLYYEVTP